ncbi:MAG: MBL fold metallo-hydrolase [Anaerolineae bacterium]
MFKVGDFKVVLINDGITYVDPGGAFGLVPRALWSRYKQVSDEGLVAMSQVCLLVQTPEGENVVIDTGMGRKLNEKHAAIWRLQRPQGDLVEGLARAGVLPEEVHLVINTHLHMDHAGGSTYRDGDAVLPTFPRAEYVVQRREYEDAMHPNERTAATYHAENFQPLVENGQMRLLDGDTELRPGITGIITRGHTPAHMSVRIESKGEAAAFLCDMASYAVHFERLGWMTAYDVEPLHTLETKRLWQQWAKDTNAILIFPHDMDRPIGRLNANNIIEPIDEPFI